MIPYIINVGLIVAGCLSFYKLFLQKVTFYRINRSVLLICLIVAFTLPLIPVPQQWSLRKVETPVTDINVTQEVPRLKWDAISRRLQSEPAKPDALVAQPEATSPFSRQATVLKSDPSLSFAQFLRWMVWIYWFGVMLLGLNFLLQFGLLLWRAYRNPVIHDGKFRIVEMSGDQAPCSFMNNIFINPEKYDWNTFNQILEHEKIHVSEKHSLDILLAEIVLVFQWFNPFAWLYRKEIENNLEFLTDDTVVNKSKIEVISYQMSLLKVSAAHLPLSLTNNYNQSLLKKRIAMMNAKRSNFNTYWKYFFLVPMIALFACLLNEPTATAQTKNPSSNKNSNTSAQNKSNNKNSTSSKNNNNDTQADKNVNKKTVKTDSDKKDKHNSDHDGGLEPEGYWFATIKGDKINFEFSQTPEKDARHHNNTEFSVGDFPNLPKVADAEFKLTREAGTFFFTGRFEGNEGKGKYKFVGDKGYNDYMNGELTEKLDTEDMMVFFMLNIKKSQVEMYKSEGYTKLDKDNIISLVALNVDKEFIQDLKASGFTNVDVDDLVSTRAMNIDAAYIKEIREAGYKNITLEQLVAFKAQGIDKEYLSTVTKFKNGDKDFDADDVVSLKAMGVDDKFADQFRAVGYTNISHEDLVSLKAVGVTPEYIKSFKSVGYIDVPIEEFVSLKSLGASPEFLKSFQAIGYKNINAEDLVGLKATGVTPDFIKGFNAIGYKDIPVEHLTGLKATGVTPDYVKKMKAKGFNYNNLEKYITLKSLGEND